MTMCWCCCRPPYHFVADPTVSSASASSSGCCGGASDGDRDVSSKESKPEPPNGVSEPAAFVACLTKKEVQACDDSPDGGTREESWLVQHMALAVRLFGFTTSTMHLAVEYLARFRSRCADPTLDPKLAATTCVWIAAKFNERREDSWRMNARVCARLTQSDAQRVIRTEMLILQTLDFDLVLPTVWTAAHALCEALSCKCSPYWMNATLLGANRRSHRPSVLAAAAVCATHETDAWVEPLGPPARDALARLVGCSATEVEGCVRFLRTMCDPVSPCDSDDAGKGDVERAIVRCGLRRTFKMHALADADAHVGGGREERSDER